MNHASAIIGAYERLERSLQKLDKFRDIQCAESGRTTVGATVVVELVVAIRDRMQWSAGVPASPSTGGGVA
jgi:hypothetical protein